MPVMRYGILSLLLLPFFVPSAHAGKSKATAEKDAVCRKWIERIEQDYPRIREDNRSQNAILAIAGTGQYGRAKELARKCLPEPQKTLGLTSIASVQSMHDRVEAALATVSEMSEKSRSFATALVAIRQAQRGDPEDAIALLPKVDTPSNRDRVLDAIAGSQARAGRLDEARQTAKTIVDARTRKRVQASIEQARRGEADAIARIRSPMIREFLSVQLLFSGRTGQEEALRAIGAAQDGDETALAKHIQAALAETKKSRLPLRRATTCSLLSVALVDAGKIEQAKQVIEGARDAQSKEWLGVSSMSGNPVLIRLLIQLDMQDELDRLLKSCDEHEFAGNLMRRNALEAMGAAYGELKILDKAETFYGTLESPADRVHFASGVLLGIVADWQEEARRQ